jgi:hypothetical protein
MYRTESDFKEALTRLNSDVEKRLITIPGEMLHVFGEQLWLADIGESGKTRAEVVAEAAKYIDDLYAKGSLKPLAENASAYRDFAAHDGLGFIEATTPEFGAILDHMEKMRRKAAIDRYPAQADQLLKDMVESPDAFIRQITYSGGEAKFY